MDCARSNALLVFVATGMLTAISGTRQRKPSLNKNTPVYTCVRLHAILPPAPWTVTSITNETPSVLTVSGEMNMPYTVVLKQAHS